MNIEEAIEILEYTMNKRLEEFCKLGKAMDSLLRKKKLRQKEHESLYNMRIEMAKIVKDFQPVKEMVLSSNPQYSSIFAELNDFYNRELTPEELARYEELMPEPCTIIKDRNPTISDLICDISNTKYEIGTLWLNKAYPSTWVLCSIKNGEAIWQDIIYACGDSQKIETDISQNSVSQADNTHTKQ